MTDILDEFTAFAQTLGETGKLLCLRVGDEIVRLREEVENLQADFDNMSAARNACREGMREIRELFAQYGIDSKLSWPEWIAALKEFAERVK